MPRAPAPDSIGDSIACIRRYNSQSIAPIGVELDLPGLRSGRQSVLSHRHIIRELRLWSTQLTRRPITRLQLNEPFHSLDGPDLTELVYALAQSLKVSTAEQIEHTVTVRLRDITKPNIALLKGLKFNHIGIRVARTCHPEHLKAVIAKLQDFRISFISLLIKWPTDPVDLERSMTTYLDDLRPETLSLCGTPATACLESLNGLLLKHGYCWSAERHAIVRQKSGLHRPPSDYLRPGPGGVASFGNFTAYNYSNPDLYQSALLDARLPVERVIQRL